MSGPHPHKPWGRSAIAILSAYVLLMRFSTKWSFIVNPFHFFVTEHLSRISLILNNLRYSGRTSDLDSILHTIDSAGKFINIAVGEYVAAEVYKTNRSWNVIDDRLIQGHPFPIVVLLILVFLSKNYEKQSRKITEFLKDQKVLFEVF